MGKYCTISILGPFWGWKRTKYTETITNSKSTMFITPKTQKKFCLKNWQMKGYERGVTVSCTIYIAFVYK